MRVCGYSHCNRKQDLIPDGEGVQIGRRILHKECAETENTIKQIQDLYYEKASNTVVFSELVRSVNGIVFYKKVAPEYLLFALRYAIANNITLHSPFGLHYLIDNYRIKKAWSDKQAKEVVANAAKLAEETIEPPKNQGVPFKRESVKPTGFGNIFGK